MDFAATAAEVRAPLDVYSQGEVDALIASNPGPPGPAGPAGPAGADGATGPTGATGPGVASGGTAGQILSKTSATDYVTGWIDAPTGTGGGNLRFEYTWSTTLTEPPTSNQIRANADPPYTAVTRLWVRYITNDGVDAKNIMLATIGAGYIAYVQDKNDSTLYAALNVTAAPTDKTGYLEFVVTWRSNGGALLNNQAVTLFFTMGSSTLPDPVTIAHGGTSATDVAGARSNLDVFSKAEIQGGVALNPGPTLANAQTLKGMNAAGTIALALIGRDASNQINIGDGTNLLINSGPTYFTGNITCGGGVDNIILDKNGQRIYGRTTGGAYVEMLYTDSANNLILGAPSWNQVYVNHNTVIAGNLTVSGTITPSGPPSWGTFG
jgi:hypothetical protein